MSSEDPTATASRAQVVLNDPLVQGALQELRAAVMEQWSTISVENEKQQIKLKHLMWATQQFEKYFKILIEGGQVSLAEAEQQSRFDELKQSIKEKVSHFL
jgi:hypothetical protein